MKERIRGLARAVVLPRRRESVDVWVSNGCLSSEPLEDAEQLPGRFIAPGMVDAHVHLSIDFADTALPFHSAELFRHNAEGHLRSGVTALRDAGYVRQLEIAEVELPERPSVQRSGWTVAPKGRYFPGFDIQKETEPEGFEAGAPADFVLWDRDPRSHPDVLRPE